MADTPTIEQLRQKAQDTRAEAERSSHPDLRANLIQIAAEYDRLAKRAEEAEEREHLRLSNEASLREWYRS